MTKEQLGNNLKIILESTWMSVSMTNYIYIIVIITYM